MNLPLISCIMPTKNRREFVPKAIEYFLRQTYPNKQLIIGDNGDSIKDLMDAAGGPWYDETQPDRVPILAYRRFRTGQTLGARRNALVECCCNGDLIAHWDDDDWYGADRLADQVKAFTSSDIEVSGVEHPLFYDLRTGKAWRYSYHGEGQYLYSATLMYRRSYWERSPFPDLQVGASVPFVLGPGRRNHAAFIQECDWYVGMAHEGNNSPKPFERAEFTPCNASAVEGRFGNDLAFYESLRAGMEVAA